MARGGNEEGNEERSKSQPLPKKPKITPTKPKPVANASTSAAAQTKRESPQVNPVAVKGGDEQNHRNRDKVQPAEARRVDSVPTRGTESLPTLTETSVLDCPICFLPLSSPVYQCENGHIACPSCCTKLAKKCPSCNLPIHIRCRAIEKVLESVQIKCPNMMYGCTKKIHYSKRLDHESTCIYAPCPCPEIDCDYVGMSNCLYTHFASQHPQHLKKFCFNSAEAIYLYADSKHAFLVEEKDNILFILNRSIESLGSLVYVVCVAPATTEREYLYKVKATRGNSSVKLETHVECVPKWRPAGDPPKVCLVVPHDLADSDGSILLVLTMVQPLIAKQCYIS